jgi:hypothetical protein
MVSGLFDFDRAISMMSGLRPAVCGASLCQVVCFLVVGWRWVGLVSDWSEVPV